MSSPYYITEAEFEKEEYMYEDYNDQYTADEAYYNMMDMDLEPEGYMYIYKEEDEDEEDEDKEDEDDDDF
jgi:hypothetical protein